MNQRFPVWYNKAAVASCGLAVVVVEQAADALSPFDCVGRVSGRLIGPDAAQQPQGKVVRDPRLGGLLNFYRRAA